MRDLPWPVRGLVAGVAGTTALSAVYLVKDRLDSGGPSDYDDSLVPGRMVQRIVHLGRVDRREQRELSLAVRWSYGPTFGVVHGALRRRLAEPWASLAFGTLLMSLTVSMFPLVGRTPPPWRWPKGYLRSELVSHAAYLAAVAAVDSPGR